MVNESNHLKTSKLILNQNALKFKLNIEKAIQYQPSSTPQNIDTEKTENQKKPDIQVGARYECIYKNLLRDIRQFFSTNFDKFLKQELNKGQRNLQVKYILFPFQILLFTKSCFDSELLSFTSDLSKTEYNQFLKQVAFTLGSFILPKYMIKCFTLN